MCFYPSVLNCFFYLSELLNPVCRVFLFGKHDYTACIYTCLGFVQLLSQDDMETYQRPYLFIHQDTGLSLTMSTILFSTLSLF